MIEGPLNILYQINLSFFIPMIITVPSVTINHTVVRSYAEIIVESLQIAAAICMIAADIIVFIWNNGGQEATIKVARHCTILWAWFHNSFVPAIEIACQHAYDLGVNCRQIWERLNSPMFIWI
jgi:hypothetical protein